MKAATSVNSIYSVVDLELITPKYKAKTVNGAYFGFGSQLVLPVSRVASTYLAGSSLVKSMLRALA